MRILRCIFVGFLLGLAVGWLWLRRQNEVLIGINSVGLRSDARATSHQDNLTEITGIGPAYARALTVIGIQSFEQLARQDADSLAAWLTTVRVSAARIKRDRWIEQAVERSQPRPSVWSGNDNGRSTKIDYTE